MIVVSEKHETKQKSKKLGNKQCKNLEIFGVSSIEAKKYGYVFRLPINQKIVITLNPKKYEPSLQIKYSQLSFDKKPENIHLYMFPSLFEVNTFRDFGP